MITSRSLSLALPLFVAPLIGACVATDEVKDDTDDTDTDTTGESDETDETDDTDETEETDEETDETDIVAADCGNDVLAADALCFEAANTLNGEGTVTAIAVGDWSNDGENDIVYGVSGAVVVSTGDGAGVQAAPASVGITGLSGTVRDLVMGPLDTNSALDIVVASDAFPALRAVFSNGEGGIASEEGRSAGEGTTFDLALGRVAPAGAVDDLVFSGFCGGVITSTGASGEGWASSSGQICSPSAVGLVRTAAGSTSLVGVNDGDDLTLWPVSEGEGVFVGEGSSSTLQANGLALVVADLNADGIDDVAVVVETNKVDVFLGDGEGGWVIEGESAYVAYDAGTGASDLVAGDFDGDGDLDLAVSNTGADSLTVLFNDGDGAFTGTDLPLATGAAPTRIAAGDLNGDAVTDLVVATSAPSLITVLISNP